jgi:predicted CoA-binding protein
MNRSIEEILRSASVVGIVGISPNENRDSHRVGKYLQEWGYRIIPINPQAEVILGEPCYPTLASCPIQIDIVDIFRRPEFILPIVNEAITIKAKVIWMQLGICHQPAYNQAIQKGLDVIMNQCISQEHARLLGIKL